MTLRPLVLAGPTAGGKTALALELAERLAPEVPVEIVSVDSALVYRGLGIATAKPSAEERRRVPHHLIDLIEPEEAYSAARFVADATRAIADIQSRGALPLLVGGTMLYVKALREGLDEIPAADPAVRMALEAEAAERGLPALHAELARVDPATAARLPPSDAQRTKRALEVWRSSGRPLSTWQRGTAVRPDAPPLLSLEPASRAWLHERIARRTAAMLEAGLVDEVRSLRQRAGISAGCPAARMVGVRQAWAALDRLEAGQLDAAGLEAEVRTTTAAATRQLAKRQITWLRGMPDREPLDAQAGDIGQRLHRAVMRRLAEGAIGSIRLRGNGPPA
jgi:tRNA dimethylallyltransferase